eukprot:scaffold121196_cov90-Phaeocystis_antarctica.AAC.2
MAPKPAFRATAAMVSARWAASRPPDGMCIEVTRASTVGVRVEGRFSWMNLRRRCAAAGEGPRRWVAAVGGPVRWELRPNALGCAFADGSKSISPIGTAPRAYGEVWHERSLFISRYLCRGRVPLVGLECREERAGAEPRTWRSEIRTKKPARASIGSLLRTPCSNLSAGVTSLSQTRKTLRVALSAAV